MPLGAVSVDLDPLRHYCRIHGVAESVLDARAEALVHQVAIPRLLELFAAARVPATFFAIGAELADPAAAEAVRSAHRAGVEIGNHTHSHDYALTRRTAEEIAHDVEAGATAIAAITQERPAGFRAPGYTLTAPLYAATAAAGHTYGSSTFPAVPYYAAKAAVMGVLTLARRPSRAVLDSPSVLAAPTTPYFPDPARPYRRGDGAVLELPISTTPGLRLPFIGTFAAALPRPVVRAAYRTLRSAPLFNFELHALDVLDEADGIPRALSRQQRDAQVPHALKLARLGEVLSWMKDDFEPVTLREAARRLAPAARSVV